MNGELTMKSKDVLKEKSFTFSIHIVEEYKKLIISKEFVMSKQLLHSGTAISALIRGAGIAQRKADDISQLVTRIKTSKLALNK